MMSKQSNRHFDLGFDRGRQLFMLFRICCARKHKILPYENAVSVACIVKGGIFEYRTAVNAEHIHIGVLRLRYDCSIFIT